MIPRAIIAIGLVMLTAIDAGPEASAEPARREGSSLHGTPTTPSTSASMRARTLTGARDA